MEKYIPKSALVAEIERRIKYDEMVMGHNTQITELLSRELNTLYELSSFINTLEVKEVDCETEWKKYFEHKGNLATVNVKDLAKHFFELGMQKSKGE